MKARTDDLIPFLQNVKCEKCDQYAFALPTASQFTTSTHCGPAQVSFLQVTLGNTIQGNEVTVV